MVGVAVVGSSSLIGPKTVETATEENPTVSPLVGVLLILVAQLFSESSSVSLFEPITHLLSFSL